ncbi:hypothetical protein [Amphritea sp. HPY]|uniref:hypothetical protein n=1 Tax=Amphritea sp. HPY TaxID=3421652 RepID=UPI003D7D0ACE
MKGVNNKGVFRDRAQFAYGMILISIGVLFLIAGQYNLIKKFDDEWFLLSSFLSSLFVLFGFVLLVFATRVKELASIRTWLIVDVNSRLFIYKLTWVVAFSIVVITLGVLVSIFVKGFIVKSVVFIALSSLLILSLLSWVDYSLDKQSWYSRKILFGLISIVVAIASFCSLSLTYSVINSIFKVDPSFFPLAISFGTVVHFFWLFNIFFSITLCLVGALLVMVFLYEVYCACFKEYNPLESYRRGRVIFVLSSAFFVSYFYLLAPKMLLGKELDDNVIKVMIADVAYELDFNSSHLCDNSELTYSADGGKTGESKKVIFLGPNYSKVLYGVLNKPQDHAPSEYAIAECMRKNAPPFVVLYQLF